MRYINKTTAVLFFTIIVTLLGSTVINSYYREIQTTVHKWIGEVYDINKPIGDWLYTVNTVVFNGAAFDQERKIKDVIYNKHQSVVLVGTNAVDPTKGGGIGTGFFVKVDNNSAWIMTNYHVISHKVENPDAYNLEVITAVDRWTYESEIVGYDIIDDIAIIKIDKKDTETWDALEFVNPEDISEGDPVVVIGHGLSLPWTSTAGQVSYNGRSAKPYNIMLQIDAVVNQGNSGGPVLGLDGKVYGIAESILSPGRSVPGWDGVAFAVHAKQAIRSMDYILGDQYATKGYVPYADLMFPVNQFTFEDVKDIAKDDRHFVYVDYKDADTNKAWAGKIAGLQQGDVILEMDGVKVTSVYQLMLKSIFGMPGDTVEIKILRDNPAAVHKVEMTVSVTMLEVDYARLKEAVR
jgi:serine protease Do